MNSLNDSIHAKVTELCRRGDDLMTSKDIQGALREYHEAWILLPEPKEDWEAATWILSAIGDAHFQANDFKHAASAFSNAVRCPDGLGNPFIHLRLGESQFEMGNMEKAKDELTRAYMGGGRELFENEDPKYFRFLESVLQPPPGQQSL